MISRSDLKNNNILGVLYDEMLDKIIPSIRLNTYQKTEYVFRENEPANNFYMIKKGRVVLEHSVVHKVAVTVGAVLPGDSFGWSSIINDENYTINAFCTEPSEIYVVNGQEIISILDSDHTMGYQMMKKIMDVIRRRLNFRTEQFIKAITAHPEIAALDKQK